MRQIKDQPDDAGTLLPKKKGPPEGRRFAKGASGNPKGRPAISKDIRDLCRSFGPHCVKRLRELVDSEDERVATMAANSLLDRGFGKPNQPIDVDATLTVAAEFENFVRQLNAPRPRVIEHES